jgi:ADP-ribose pyrophosphatase YjhB (NUDIX family)
VKSLKIRVIVVCVIRFRNSVLVLEGYDTMVGRPFYRPPGGEVEFGETTEEAIKREIREELSLGITNLELLGVLENIFNYEGEKGHEIVYVYEGKFTDVSAYERNRFELLEDSGEVWSVRWHKLDSFDDYHRLVPEGLMGLLNTA